MKMATVVSLYIEIMDIYLLHFHCCILHLTLHFEKSILDSKFILWNEFFEIQYVNDAAILERQDTIAKIMISRVHLIYFILE